MLLTATVFASHVATESPRRNPLARPAPGWSTHSAGSPPPRLQAPELTITCFHYVSRLRYGTASLNGPSYLRLVSKKSTRYKHGTTRTELTSIGSIQPCMHRNYAAVTELLIEHPRSSTNGAARAPSRASCAFSVSRDEPGHLACTRNCVVGSRLVNESDGDNCAHPAPGQSNMYKYWEQQV